MGTIIGVISDTHGLLDPEVDVIFEKVDWIIHAGDIGDGKVLEHLKTLAPLTAVAGNVDGFSLGDAGETARVTLDGLRFFVTHVIDRPNRLTREVTVALASDPADVVIFGHSHLPHDERIGRALFFNPASAGPRRFDYPRAVGLIEIDGGVARGRHVALDAESEAALEKYMNALSHTRR
ncbi:MAG: metallophosphoesterase family protein [Thermoanaerobaculia bacterium]